LSISLFKAPNEEGTVQVKICGITEFEDALGAVRLGVDALGFIFAPSPRRIAPEMARFVIDAMPPFIKNISTTADSIWFNFMGMSRRISAAN